MDDKTSKFVVNKIVEIDNFNRPVQFCQSIRLINMMAVFFRGHNNTVGIGSSLKTARMRYCGSIRRSGKRYSLKLLNRGRTI